MVNGYIKIAILAGCLAVGFGGGWSVNGWRKDASHAEELAAIDAAKDQAVSEAESRRQRVAAAYAALDAKHYQEITNAQAVQDRLRADLAAGRKRLLVRATCPAPATVPAGAGAPGLGDAAAPELRGDAIEAFHDLRRQLDAVTAQLLWFQDAERSRHAVEMQK